MWNSNNDYSANPLNQMNYAQDMDSLQKMKKHAVWSIICQCLFILIVPVIISIIFSIVDLIKVTSLNNKQMKDKLLVVSIVNLVLNVLTILWPIVTAVITLNQIKNIQMQLEAYNAQQQY
ncbi:hypothetical protein [Ureaplasma ceti]|uniref:Uncharacterized protein n=1 Tax=Ureaplasma ceti TaxID=3119530 RepID=A0ABP9U4J3_9BACT